MRSRRGSMRRHSVVMIRPRGGVFLGRRAWRRAAITMMTLRTHRQSLHPVSPAPALHAFHFLAEFMHFFHDVLQLGAQITGTFGRGEALRPLAVMRATPGMLACFVHLRHHFIPHLVHLHFYMFGLLIQTSRPQMLHGFLEMTETFPRFSERAAVASRATKFSVILFGAVPMVAIPSVTRPIMRRA